MKKKFHIVTLFLVALITSSCLDPFNPPASLINVNYLVVDGYLNSVDSSCLIKLSRTIPLSSLASTPSEKNATVKIEEEDGGTFLLTGSGNGEYSGNKLALKLNKKYRLSILTKENIEYKSDFVPLIKTPAIDSITWGAGQDGISIYVDTHASNNDIHYYKWKYTETWEYNSAFSSYYIFQNDRLVDRPFQVYHCYNTSSSTDILIKSSETYENNGINKFPLVQIPWESPKFKIKYSIAVEQSAISKEAFEYWQELKKNTENLGTLFDPLPSTTIGNIHCITDPKQIAIGNFNISSIEQKRIFISGQEISRPRDIRIITGYENCQLDSLEIGQPTGASIPIGFIYDQTGRTLLGYLVSYPFCVDCREKGGTLTRPNFWE